MAKPEIIIFNRKKVYTVKTNILIKRESFPALLDTLKSKYKKNVKLQECRSVYDAIKHVGWTFRGSVPGVTRLIYNDDYWRMTPLFILNDLAEYIEDGGYTDIFHSVDGSCRSYSFYQGKVLRKDLVPKYLDTEDPIKMKELLQETVQHLLNLNISKKEIDNLVSETCVLELFSD